MSTPGNPSIQAQQALSYHHFRIRVGEKDPVLSILSGPHRLKSPWNNNTAQRGGPSRIQWETPLLDLFPVAQFRSHKNRFVKQRIPPFTCDKMQPFGPLWDPQ